MISDVLDVAIGVLFVFLMVSTLCASIREGMEAFLKTRARYLEHAIFNLLGDGKADDELANRFFAHPLVKGLFQGEHTPQRGEKLRMLSMGSRNMPSYIPSKNFSLALLDVVARYETHDAELGPVSLSSLHATLGKLPAGSVRDVLQAATMTSEKNLEHVRLRLEQWYDSAMDRVSGRYKRASQLIIVCVATLIVGLLNIDTLRIADQLYKDQALRKAAVAAVENAAASGLTYQQASQELRRMALPIGWQEGDWKDLCEHPAQHIAGLLITVLATMLGAPFWFDVLNKVMVIRATVKPHEKSREEKSED